MITLLVLLVGRVEVCLIKLGVPLVVKDMLGSALSTSDRVVLEVERNVLSEQRMRSALIISMVLGV